MRMIVRISADRAIVPNDGPLARKSALWIVCVDVGGGGGSEGSAKYQAPITLAVVIRITPRDTPQLHSHTATVPVIAQLAHP